MTCREIDACDRPRVTPEGRADRGDRLSSPAGSICRADVLLGKLTRPRSICRHSAGALHEVRVGDPRRYHRDGRPRIGLRSSAPRMVAPDDLVKWPGTGRFLIPPPGAIPTG